MKDMKDIDFRDIDVRQIGDHIRISGSHFIDGKRENFGLKLTKEQAIIIQEELNRIYSVNLLNKVLKGW